MKKWEEFQCVANNCTEDGVRRGPRDTFPAALHFLFDEVLTSLFPAVERVIRHGDVVGVGG